MIIYLDYLILELIELLIFLSYFLMAFIMEQIDMKLVMLN